MSMRFLTLRTDGAIHRSFERITSWNYQLHIKQVYRVLLFLIQLLVQNQQWEAALRTYTTIAGAGKAIGETLFNIGIGLILTSPNVSSKFALPQLFRAAIDDSPPEKTHYMFMEKAFSKLIGGQLQEAYSDIWERNLVCEEAVYYGMLGMINLLQHSDSRYGGMSKWFEAVSKIGSQDDVMEPTESLENAIEMLAKSVEIDATSEYFHQFLAMAKIETGAVTDGLELLAAVCKSSPDKPTLWRIRSRSLFSAVTKSGYTDIDELKESWSEWIRLDPASDEAYFGLLQLFQARHYCCISMFEVTIKRMDVLREESETRETWKWLLTILRFRELAANAQEWQFAGSKSEWSEIMTQLHSWRLRFWSEEAYRKQKEELDKITRIFMYLFALKVVGSCPYTLHCIDEWHFMGVGEVQYYAKQFGAANLVSSELEKIKQIDCMRRKVQEFSTRKKRKRVQVEDAEHEKAKKRAKKS